MAEQVAKIGKGDSEEERRAAEAKRRKSMEKVGPFT
jgi:hypothetical protein